MRAAPIRAWRYGRTFPAGLKIRLAKTYGSRWAHSFWSSQGVFMAMEPNWRPLPKRQAPERDALKRLRLKSAGFSRNSP
jgi:hypothetical protein